MSQAGTIDAVSSTPSVPVSFTTDSGTAVPVANNLNVLGDAAQGSATSASGATVTVTNLDATTSQKGVLETSTGAETIGGGSTTVAVTPASLLAKIGVESNFAMPYSQGVGTAFAWTAGLTNGQVVIGSNGGAPVASTLTAGAGITITNAANSITIAMAGGSTGIDSFAPDSGTSPVVPDGAGLVTMAGAGSVTTVGSLNTLTFQLTGVTQHAIQIGGASSALANVGPLTNGQLVIGSTGVAPVAGSITSTGGTITVTPGAGTINLEANAVGTVTSVSGTTNRIDIGGTAADPVVDIASTYVGQTSITTVGTVATGTWNGTAVAEGYGGTNQTTYTTGDLLYASAANTLSKLAVGSNTEVLTLAGGVPTWAAPAVSDSDHLTPIFLHMGS